MRNGAMTVMMMQREGEVSAPAHARTSRLCLIPSLTIFVSVSLSSRVLKSMRESKHA